MIGHYIYEYLADKVNRYLVVNSLGRTLDVVVVDKPLSEPIIHNYDDICMEYGINIIENAKQSVIYESMSAKGIRFKWNNGETTLKIKNPENRGTK